eukprot:TRINITY_DN46508_c0_g1_i1.p1 TRINITY_DN46508_c0_g1~~TRINITY_DN46508_c0_g1_i1.p1  ORF type:complete len:468 (-),score=63.88 TRINITY_DN46508_c0_g1_i1:87-1490(-)
MASIGDTWPCDDFQIEVAASKDSECHALPNHGDQHASITTYRARMQKLWRIIGIWGMVDGCIGVILAVSALLAGQAAIAGDDPCRSPDWIISVCILASHLIKGSTAARLLLRRGESSHRGFLKQLMVITIFCCLCAALTAVEYYLGAKHLHAGGNCKALGSVLLFFASLDTGQLMEEICVWSAIFGAYFGMRKENPSMASCRVASVSVQCAEECCASALEPRDRKSLQNPRELDSSEHLHIALPTCSELDLLEEAASWPTQAVETPTSASILVWPPSDPVAGTPANSSPEQRWLPPRQVPVCNKNEVRMLLSHYYTQSAKSRCGSLARASERCVTDNPQQPACCRGSETGMITVLVEGGVQKERDDFGISCAESLASAALTAPQVLIDKQCCHPLNYPVEFSRRRTRQLLSHIYAQIDEMDSVSDKSVAVRRRQKRKGGQKEKRRSRRKSCLDVGPNVALQAQPQAF